MKTAAEWAQYIEHASLYHRPEIKLEDNIKAIQLEAYKAGMNLAIDIIQEHTKSSKRETLVILQNISNEITYENIKS